MTFAYKTCLRITAVLGGDDAIQWASWHGAEPDLEQLLIGWVGCGAGPACLVPAGDCSACRDSGWMAISSL